MIVHAATAGLRAVLLGATGFVGRYLVERWPADAPRPRLLVHRTRPVWLEASGDVIRGVDLADPRSVAAGVDGCDVLVDLLRPDGTRWLEATMGGLLPALAATSLRRVIHASSIDVYGATREREVDETTRPQPVNAYQHEHVALERLFADLPHETCIVRPGAVFGPGGRNLVGLAQEIAAGRRWRLAARRALYGRRRMHLVSAENVADTIIALTFSGKILDPVVNICDDVEAGNDFRHVQQTMIRAFAAPEPPRLPDLPPIALSLALASRRDAGRAIWRRFSRQRAEANGFSPEKPFASRLESYAQWLARQEQVI